MSNKEHFFPTMIVNLSEVAEDTLVVTIRDVTANPEYQVLIMEYKVDVPFDGKMSTNHCSQWGVVLDGEATLFLEEPHELKHLRKGDTFFIPQDTPHGVATCAGYKDITVYDKPRYAH